MTGPPTPPPSSATEIEDAARTSLPPPQAAVPATEVPQAAVTPALPQAVTEQAQPVTGSQNAYKTTYELLFPSIVELAKGGRVKDLVEIAERGDLSVRTHSSLP